ncbi:hypothetical protein GCM10009860_23540 [Microbacterium mitrae]
MRLGLRRGLVLALRRTLGLGLRQALGRVPWRLVRWRPFRMPPGWRLEWALTWLRLVLALRLRGQRAPEPRGPQ